MITTPWKLQETEFTKENIEINGSRFLIGNGYMGYRGTLEEFNKEQLVSLNMAGLFDKSGDLWRESVNAPNPFYVKCIVDGMTLEVCEENVVSHTQTLDISCALHSRKTVFCVNDTQITIKAERFLSLKEEKLAALKFTVCADKDIKLILDTNVDSDVWNINGEHFEIIGVENKNGVNRLNIQTLENKTPMCVYEYISGAQNHNEVELKGGIDFTFTKLCGIYWGCDVENSQNEFLRQCEKDYDSHLLAHKTEWEKVWDKSDVIIEGDDEAQFAMRYSIYHLNCIIPRHTDKCGIPARGLSGQVYKGAAFWDTEMFMMPFFSFTDSALCKNLVNYRINTIDGSKRKAKEFGFDGAFYAWEAQETGDDACSLFNLTDIITNRPLRTHFKDGQIHVSADMVYALWNYIVTSGDYSILADNGLEMMYQVIYFYYSHTAYKPLKDRYEHHNVVGPDEYHEQVNNNAFTNKMIKYTLEAFGKALSYTKANMPDTYSEFIEKHDIGFIDEYIQKLYVPAPDSFGIIEQFDGYMELEDISIPDLKKRIIKPNEYLGGGCGIATTTRVIKQADVIMMLNVFRNEYSKDILAANWDFYEPYTEHGSSLSACAYGIVAAIIGRPDWAYKYFMKTATIDITGDSKQYVGDLYIGGTHPAANGGSWNVAIFGFGGVSYTDDTLDISPNLPQKWNKLSFKLNWKGVPLSVTVTKNGTTIETKGDTSEINVTVNKEKYVF